MKGRKGALAWYDRGAAAGSREAMYQVGLHSSNIPHSFKMFERAADLGHADSCYNAGVWSYKGKGWAIPKNHPLAQSRFQQAAAYGHAGAAYFLGVVHQSGNLEVVGFNAEPVVAVGWFKKCLAMEAAPALHAKANHRLAVCYWKGFGTEKEPQTGARLMKRAADLGSVDALTDLWRMHWRGEGVFTDQVKAVSILKKAAELNDPRGCYDLGMLYRSTYPEARVYKDNSTAVLWLNRAYSKGHKGAGAELKKIEAEAAAVL